MSLTLHTTKGDIKIELECEKLPTPCANFLALSASSKYTNIPFHRIIPNYIIQSGNASSPSSKSKAKSTSISAFPNVKRLPDQTHPDLTFNKAGVVAFANNGNLSKRGIGSQFFITLVPASHLNGTCTIIGNVIHGMDTVKSIANQTPLSTDVNEQHTPQHKNNVLIQNVTVHCNPFATGQIQFQIP